MIEVAGLEVGNITEEATATVDEGLVIRTSPVAKTTRRQGSKIDIVVATVAMVSIPDVTDKDSDTARQELEALGFQVTIKEEYSEKVAQGLVIKTDPGANSSAEKGQNYPLRFQRSSATSCSKRCWKTQENATQILQTAGFSIGTITQEYSSSVTAGQVISTDPVANTELTKGSIINLVVSKGKELIMPDLTSGNYTYSQARSQLQALGVNVESIENKKIEAIIQRQVTSSLDNIPRWRNN